MSTAAPIAPTKAAGVTSAPYSGSRSSTRMPVSPAPEEIPMICGSAKGFFITACRTAPERDRFTPTSSATIVRGNRMFMRICACVPRSPDKAARISGKGISTEPFMILTMAARHAKTANMPNKHICRPCCPMLIGTPQDRRALPYTRQPQDNVCQGSGGRNPEADSKAFSAGQQAAPARQDSPQWFLPCSP